VRRCIAGVTQGFLPTGKQHRWPVRWGFDRCAPAALHIWKLKPQNPMTGTGKAIADGFHERRIHRRAGTMGQDNQGRRRAWPGG
jgi:hypothetical protein